MPRALPIRSACARVPASSARLSLRAEVRVASLVHRVGEVRARRRRQRPRARRSGGQSRGAPAERALVTPRVARTVDRRLLHAPAEPDHRLPPDRAGAGATPGNGARQAALERVPRRPVGPTATVAPADRAPAATAE